MKFRYLKPGQTLFYYDPPDLAIVLILKKDERYVWYGIYSSKREGGFSYEEQKTTFDYWNEDREDSLKIKSNHMQAAIMKCFGDMRWYSKM